MIPVCIRVGATDRRIRGLPFAMLVHLHEHLDARRFTGLKIDAVRRSFGISERHVFRAFGRLVRHGYLIAGPLAGDVGRQVRSYRLLPPTQAPRAPLTDLAPVRDAA